MAGISKCNFTFLIVKRWCFGLSCATIEKITQEDAAISYADRIFKDNCREILHPRRVGHGSERASPLGGRHARPHGEEIRHHQPLRPAGRSSPSSPSAGPTSKPASTSCCGSGSRSPTTSTTCGATSGTAGRTRTAPSARPTAISWR